MKAFYTLLCLLSFFNGFSQRFDWVSFTPLATNFPNGGSGGLSVIGDSEGYIYNVCVFNDPIIVGGDTLFHIDSYSRPDLLITKWNQAGEPIDYIHIASLSNNGNPYADELLFDEVNGQILLIAHADYDGLPIQLLGNADTTLAINRGTVLRFTTDLDFVSNHNIPGGYTYGTTAVVKNGFLYAAHGYNSAISKSDSQGNVLWSKTCTGAGYHIHDIAISDDDNIYVFGYYSSGFLSALTLDGVSITPPSLGNNSHTIIYKLDTDGTVLQGDYFVEAVSIGSPARLSIDTEGNIYVACGYDIDGQSIGNHILSPPTGGTDALVAKLNSSLETQWVTELHHTGGNLETQAISIHPSGKIMVAGSYGNNAIMGEYEFDFAFYGSCFMVQLNDETGQILYAKNFGSLGAGTGRPHDVYCIDDKYYITGLSYGNSNGDPAMANYGCYTQTKTNSFLTCFNDIPFETPTVELVYGSVSLIASTNVDDATFQWFLNGEEIEGETGSSIVPSVAGNYEVVVSYYGCTASDTYTLECLPTTGTDVIIACNGYTWIDGITYTSNNSSATHLLTSSLGCDSLVTLNLIIEQISDVVTVSGNTLSAAQNNAEYIWLDCDAKLTAIPNETEQTFTPTQNGRYAVQVITGECSVISECVEITTVALNDYETHLSINIYPNPAKDVVMLSNVSIGTAITVYDLTGKMIYSAKTSSTQAVINTVGFANGVYQLQVENRGRFERMKFVVNK